MSGGCLHSRVRCICGRRARLPAGDGGDRAGKRRGDERGRDAVWDVQRAGQRRRDGRRHRDARQLVQFLPRRHLRQERHARGGRDRQLGRGVVHRHCCRRDERPRDRQRHAALHGAGRVHRPRRADPDAGGRGEARRRAGPRARPHVLRTLLGGERLPDQEGTGHDDHRLARHDPGMPELLLRRHTGRHQPSAEHRRQRRRRDGRHRRLYHPERPRRDRHAGHGDQLFRQQRVRRGQEQHHGFWIGDGRPPGRLRRV